ncbi:MAG: FlgD immunoglobulin-like domain containing protein, partial [Bacteroidota bacterium]
IRIGYSIAHSCVINLRITGVNGTTVKTLKSNDFQVEGTYNLSWDGTDSKGNSVSSGTYWVVLSCGSVVKTRKIELVR